MEKWGLGALGMNREEFLSCSLGELNRRIEGFMMLKMQIENIGARRIFTVIHNGLASFGGGKQRSEEKLWPMELDKLKPKKVLPKSEVAVEINWDKIKKIWPDAKKR